MDVNEQVASCFLYSLLVQLCHGEALAMVRLVPPTNGLLAWRKLVYEYEPEVAAPYCAVLASLLMPEWRDDLTLHQFMEPLLVCERRVISYEASVGALMPDSYNCAVVMKKGPKDIRAFLRGHAEDFTQDTRLKHALHTY
eukprot:5853437-Heterocapsa_arctica.AAC.1